MSLPRALQHSAQRLNDSISVIGHKVYPNTRGARRGGDTVTFVLPANAIVSLDSLKMFLKLRNENTTSGNTYTTALSPHAYISRLHVSSGGVTLCSIENYGAVAGEIDIMGHADKSTPGPRREQVINGANGEATVSVDGFMFGPLAKGGWSKYLDTGVFKDLTIAVTLSQPKAAQSASASAVTNDNIKYADMWMTADVVSFGADSFRDAIRQAGSMRLKFRNLLTNQSPSFGDAIDHQMRVTTKALKRIWSFPKAADFATATGTSTGGIQVSTAPDTAEWYMTVAGQRLVSHDVTPAEAFEMLSDAVRATTGDNIGTTSLSYANWLSTLYAMVRHLGIADESLVSGLDTFEVAGDVSVNVKGLGSGTRVLITAAECVSTVEVDLRTGEMTVMY